MSSSIFQPVIEGFWVKNYKVLKQISLGSSFQQSLVTDLEHELATYELTPLTTFIGASGTGKSTILDVFGFLADCLNLGIDDAFARRGGYDLVYTHGGVGPISIGIVFRACSEPRPLTYALNISKKANTTSAYVESEALIYRSNDHTTAAQPIMFFQNGDKYTRHVIPWHNANLADLETVKRTDQKHLALSLLGGFDDLPDVPQLKRHLEQFHLACYTPDNAAKLIPTKFKFVPSGRLETEFKRMEEKHHFELPGILEVISQRIPFVESVTYEKNEMGRPILYFKFDKVKMPFYAHQIGEGMLRLFSHFLLLEDPIPTPLIGIEEPSACMDDIQTQAFVSQIRRHVTEMGGTQFFITTHQQSLVDFMDPTEVWIFDFNNEGNVQVYRALDELAFQGVDLNSVGPYWYTDYIYRNKR
ncbi:MAG: AAA family ATPase, partial [Planctomycetaceae bacterium]|jgi:predicted ATPase|nr:AAA family ATPase [Planctomycetaceae bacterium]